MPCDLERGSSRATVTLLRAFLETPRWNPPGLTVAVGPDLLSTREPDGCAVKSVDRVRDNRSAAGPLLACFAEAVCLQGPHGCWHWTLALFGKPKLRAANGYGA